MILIKVLNVVLNKTTPAKNETPFSLIN